MSYRSASNYYGTIPSSQSNLSQYATSAESISRSTSYQTPARNVDDSRQVQYGSNTYEWPAQNRNGSANGVQNTYGGTTWQERPNSSNGYTYQRDAYAQSEQPASNHAAYQSRDLYNSQNVHALNHLAYASGLEPAATANSEPRPSQHPSLSGYTPTASISNSQTMTASSTNTGSHFAANMQPSSSASYASQSDSFTAHADNQNLALNAATALAGAVRNQNSQMSQQIDIPRTVRTSNSPKTTNTDPAVQQQPQRTNVNQSHKRPSGPPLSTRDSSAPVQSEAVSARKARKLPVPKQHLNPQPFQSTNEAQGKLAQQQQNLQQPSNLNPQSIANLMTENNDADQQTNENLEQQPEMQYYIDPSQVFNPYHREHERKRREAAEAEAKRKQEEQRLADEKRKAGDNTTRGQNENPTTANSKSKITKKGQVTGNGVESQIDNLTTGHVSEVASNEETMALEMQKMMAKMKEFRSTNPLLFQKLWNDMRSSGTNAAPPSAPVETPSPQVSKINLPMRAEKVASPTRSRDRKQVSSSTIGTTPMNGFKVTIENNEEGLPDLGRFPAERRIRHAGKQKSDTSAEQERDLVEAPLPAIGQAHSSTTVAASVASTQSAVIEPSTSSAQSTAPVQPTRTIDTSVAWPEPRRRAVAIAAIRLLKANPDNASVEVTAQEICAILEHNPSYLDLCAALETRGLRFHRNSFARELLRSVPELHTPASKGATPIGQDPATISPEGAKTTQSSLAPPATSQPGSDSLTSPHSTTSVRDTLQPIVKTEPPRPPSKPFKARIGPLTRVEPPPGSKAAAARKRDFAELIDLIELNEDDNYVLPSKQPRFDSQVQPDPFKRVENSLRTGFVTNAAEPLRFNPQVQLDTRYESQAHVQPPPQLPRESNAYGNTQFNGFQQPGFQQEKTKIRMILAKKLDKSEALQKSYYDPKTVARDILIASGRHTSEKPLNLHLASLIGNHMDLDSDVSTFDWDSVDPGGPPPPKVEYIDIPTAPPKFKLADRVRKRARLTADTDQNEETRDPKEGKRSSRPTSATPAELEPRLPAPSPVAHPTPSQPDHDNNHQSVHRRHRQSENTHVGNKQIAKSTPPIGKISVDIPIGSTSQRSTGSVSRQTSISQSKMDAENSLAIRRRGRPPGSKNKQPSVATMKQLAKATVTEQSVQNTPEPVMHSYKCKWVKCHAELHNIDTLQRHILKKHSPDDDEIKHNSYVCWWKRCRYLESDGEGNMGPTHAFKTKEKWSAHIDEDHVQPIAQKYGDGPKTTHIGKPTLLEFNVSKFLFEPQVRPITRTVSYTDPHSVHTARERYLADLNGRATTPLVSPDGNSDHPLDAMVLIPAYPHGPKNDKEKADVTGQNAFMKAHGNKHKDTKKAAEEVVRAMAVRKAKIGPGIDRGGCTLVNEARRSTFMQAPGISRIVDGEY